jgi:mRNA interferase MazF
MTYERGDVVLVPFPNTNQPTYKTRPALIVQDPRIATDLNQLIMAPITTSEAVSNGPTRIFIKNQTRHGLRMGLRQDSKILVDNLATVPIGTIQKKLGTCGLMAEVNAALKLTLKLM